MGLLHVGHGAAEAQRTVSQDANVQLSSKRPVAHEGLIFGPLYKGSSSVLGVTKRDLRAGKKGGWDDCWTKAAA